MRALHLGYLQSSDDCKPSFSGKKRTKRKPLRPQRPAAHRHLPYSFVPPDSGQSDPVLIASEMVTFLIPLFLPTLGKAIPYCLLVKRPETRSAKSLQLPAPHTSADLCRRMHTKRKRKRYVTEQGGRRR